MTQKSFLILVCSLFFTYNVYSQSYKEKIDHIFEHVDRTTSQTGLVKEYGIRFNEIEIYDGTIQSNNEVDRIQWESLYASLYSMQFNDSINLPDPDSIVSIVETKPTTVTSLAFLHYDYEQFKPQDQAGALILNEQIYLRPTIHPYEYKTAVAIAPVRKHLHGAEQKFSFYSDLFFHNQTHAIFQLEVDLDDGQGYRTVNFDQVIVTTYATEGIKTLQFRVTYTNQTIVVCRSRIEVQDIATVNTTLRYSEPVEVSRNDLSFTTTRPYKGEAGSAKVTIAYADNDNILDKPLIVVPGFDPESILNPNDPGYTLESLLDNFDNGGIDIPINLDFFGQTLRQKLESEGYDIVFIDFADGTDYIQRNAFVVEDVIEWVNAQKVGTTPNVVLGMSMGGLVARYALRDMELRNIDHDTNLYISHNAPHQGANAPLGFQALIKQLASIKLEHITGIIGLDFGSLSGDIQRGIRVLNSPAAQQMLIYQIAAVPTADGFSHHVDNTVHQEFMQEYQLMGYPRLNGIRNIAIANGSECGTEQPFSPSARLITLGTVKK